MATNYGDVHAFHQKFEVPHPELPEMLPPDVFSFRHKFLQEEINEFEAAYDTKNYALMVDALVDLVYVAMGTAVLMGAPWQMLWDDVQRANMSKVRAASVEESKAGSGRGHSFDVIKPPGFVPPQTQAMLIKYIRQRIQVGNVPIQAALDTLDAINYDFATETAGNAEPVDNRNWSKWITDFAALKAGE